MIRLGSSVSAAAAAAALLTGCGDAASPKSTTPASTSTATTAFVCPLTAAKIGDTIGSVGMVLLSEFQQVCEYGTPLGNAVKATSPDPKEPIVDIALLRAPIGALQATAKTEHPGATVTPRPDLGRQSFVLAEPAPGGGRRATIISYAGASVGSYATSVTLPAGKDAAARALKLAIRIYDIKQ